MNLPFILSTIAGVLLGFGGGYALAHHISKNAREFKWKPIGEMTDHEKALSARDDVEALFDSVTPGSVKA